MAVNSAVIVLFVPGNHRCVTRFTKPQAKRCQSVAVEAETQRTIIIMLPLSLSESLPGDLSFRLLMKSTPKVLL